MIEKINNNKGWFSKKINKIDKPLVKLRKKGEDSKSEMLREEIPMDTKEIHRIIRDY